MARSNVAGDHVVLVLTAREADAVERSLSFVLGDGVLEIAPLEGAVRRSFRALVAARRILRERRAAA